MFGYNERTLNLCPALLELIKTGLLESELGYRMKAPKYEIVIVSVMLRVSRGHFAPPSTSLELNVLITF